MSEIDKFLDTPSGKEPSEIDAFLGPAKPDATAGDVVKEFGAAAVDTVGGGFQAGAELITQGVNRAAGSEVLPTPVNPLKTVSDSIRDTQTAGGKAARGDQFKGDILAPDTWKAPDTGSGLAMGLAQGVGSVAAMLMPLGALRYAGIGQKALVGAGAAMGGAATAGGAVEQVREEVGKMPEPELAALPAYQTHIAAGFKPAEARKKIADDSALFAGVLSGVFGALQGGFNAKILDDLIAKKGISLLLGKMAEKRLSRVAIGAGAGAVGEGAQEGMEQVGQNVGENIGRGQPAMENPTRDTFGNVVLGAAVGGGMGAGAGALSVRAPGVPMPPGTPPPPPGEVPPAGVPPAPENPPPAGVPPTGSVDATGSAGATPAPQAPGAITQPPIPQAPGFTAEQEDLRLRRMERQAMMDGNRQRGQMNAEEMDMLTSIREALNDERAEQGMPPVTLEEWRPVIAAFQPKDAPRQFPFVTRAAADKHAQQQAKRLGQPFEVVPHPDLEGRWVAVPQGTEPSPSATTQQPVEATYAGQERRTDTAGRTRVADMSPEERATALLTSDKAGIPNRRAYDEAPKRAVQSSIDLDGMKRVNDTMGHAAGDMLLAKVGEALRDAGVDAYHLSGDEFAAQFDDETSGREWLEAVRLRLSNATITVETPDGRMLTHKGIGFGYGLGKDLDTADFALQADKADRKARGLRSDRADAGVVPEEPAAGQQADEREPAAEIDDGPGVALGLPTQEELQGSATDVDAIFDQALAEVKSGTPRPDGMALAKPEAMERAKRYYGNPDGTTKGHIIEMSPDEFLALAAADDGDAQRRADKKGPFDVDQFNEEHLPYLDVNDAKEPGRVSSHEGRARALMAKAAGIKKMPVVISSRYKFDEENPFPEALMAQRRAVDTNFTLTTKGAQAIVRDELDDAEAKTETPDSIRLARVERVRATVAKASINLNNPATSRTIATQASIDLDAALSILKGDPASVDHAKAVVELEAAGLKLREKFPELDQALDEIIEEFTAKKPAVDKPAIVDEQQPAKTMGDNADRRDKTGRVLKEGDTVLTGKGLTVTIGKFVKNAEGKVIVYDSNGKAISRAKSLTYKEAKAEPEKPKVPEKKAEPKTGSLSLFDDQGEPTKEAVVTSDQPSKAEDDAGAKLVAERKALAENKKAVKTAIRTADAQLYNVVLAHPDLVTIATSSPEDFKAGVERIAAEWKKEQRDGADEVRIAAIDGLVTDKMLAPLKREAVKLAKAKEAEKKPAAKLRNTGEDLRRHWELLKAELKARNNEQGITAMNRILAEASRANIFAGVLGSAALPAAHQHAESVRNSVRTFPEWLSRRDGPMYDLNGQWGIKGDLNNIAAFVRGEKYMGERDTKRYFPSSTAKSTKDMDVQERIDFLSFSAERYVEHVRQIAAPLRGKLNASETVPAIGAFLWKEPDAVPTGQARWLSQETLTPEARGLYDFGLFDNGYNVVRDLHPMLNRAAALMHNEATIESKSRTKPMVPPRLTAIVREGRPEVRKGNVTPKALKAEFGFADVGFGSYVMAGEDQALLNHAWDAFADLADHIGIDHKQIGFGGRLHFTLGALGHGSKAAATFHPAHPGPNGIVQVINLTKTKGDGTVAHEWLHALDHFLRYTADGKKAMEQLVRALKYKNPDFERIRQHVIYSLRHPEGWTSGGRKMRLTALGAGELAADHYSRPEPTEFKRAADKMDPKYWGNDRELPARAWEAWVYDSMEGDNNFLVNPWVAAGATAPPNYKGTPYPLGEERKAFAEWFKALVHSLDTSKKEITVDLVKWAELKPKEGAEFREAIERLKADLPLLLEQLQREDAAKLTEKADEAARKAREALQAKADAAKKAREEAEARERPPETPATPTGVLDEAALGALFDLAKDSITAENRENVTAPEPGAPALHNEPITKVDKHEAPKADKGATDLIADAAKLGVTGIDEALKGLNALFGGGKIQSFPGGFDEDSYAKAKPHFEAALRAFQDAGRTLLDFFKMLIERYGDGVKPYAVRFAKDMKLTAQLGEQPRGSIALARWVKGELSRPGAQSAISSPALFAKADEAFGGTQADGKYTPKDAYDAAEAGMNLWILDQGNRMSTLADGAGVARSVLNTLKAALDKLPTQTKRTAEQLEFQQFSTVPPLAYMANWVANIEPGETMGEPSAGLGGLAVFAKATGAKLVLNELSSRRAEVLQQVFPDAEVHHENAEQIGNILETKPTVIVMNPPFSASAGRMEGKRDTMVGAKHIESALEWLQPGGRLVAIVGKGMADGEPRFAPWWAKLKERYNVRAILSLNGEEYAKYGTTYDNVLFVIDKTGPQQGSTVTGRVEAYSELPALLEGIRNDRHEPSAADRAPEQFADQPGRGEAPAPGLAQPDGPARPEPGAVGDAGSGDLPGARGAGGGARGGRPGSGDGVGNGKPGGRRGAGAGRAGQPESGGSGEPGAGVDSRPNERVELDAAGATRRATELTDAVFEAYEPQKVRVKGAKPHPGKLVESAAMAAVEPIDATYAPNLPKEAISEGRISAAQIEAVVYAGQAHAEMLPPVMVAGAQVAYRRGYFVGDGTGVGKGREIAAIILDNMRQGRKKAVWLSASAGLVRDARRDFGGVVGKAGEDVTDIFELRDAAAGGAGPSGKVTRKDGIMFLTYDTLKGGEKVAKEATPETRQARTTSVKQIVEWLGPDFDGVIALDEAHKIKNLGGQKGARGKTQASQRALSAEELQDKLPHARVVYVSATGATEVANLAYAKRLGLWGANTAFTDANDFTSKIGAGLASMELVARDMKAMGVYISRSLSYDGVEQDVIDASFTPLQKQIYDELALAWQIVLKDVRAALASTGADKNGQAKGAAMIAFWSTQQRFFNQVITAMMTPSVLERSQAELAAGKAVIFQLVNTNEATQERMVESAEANDIALEELDFTPKQALIEYLRKSFPVMEFEEYTDDNGNVRSRPVQNAKGEPVVSKAAEAKRDALIEHIEKNLRVPDNPIDLIYQAFGEKDVAEVSGRGRRFERVMKRDGSFTLEERKRTGKSNEADAAAFMDDKKHVIIFTDAGGTGYSFHSDMGVKNQRRRFHVMLQPGWVAENAMQGLGRSHRSNEANQPLVALPKSDLKAQKRFISSIARRLDQLGALTKGQRNAASQGMFTASDNLESKYAVAALRQLVQDLAPGNRSIEGARELVAAMGFDEIYDPLSGAVIESKHPTIQRFLNRLLSLTTTQQDLVFTEFEVRMDAAVDAAKANGSFDDGMQTLKALKVAKLRDEVVHTDERSKAQTRYLELELTTATALNTWERMQETLPTFGHRSHQFYFDTQTQQPFVVVNMGESTDGAGKVRAKGVRYNVKAPSRGSRSTYIDNRDSYERGGDWRTVRRDESGNLVSARPEKRHGDEQGNFLRYKKIGLDEAQYLWNEAHAAAPTTETETVHMLTGALLPIWDRIETDDDTRTKSVVRTQTDEGERLIGRLLPESDRAEVLKRLGVGSIRQDMTAQEIEARILGGEQAKLSNGWLLKKVRIANDNRIEIIAGWMTPGERRILVSQGAIEEIISYQPRIFIPTNNPAVFDAITRGANKPVVDFIAKGVKDETNFSEAVRPTPEALRVKGIPLKTLRDAIVRKLGRDLPDDAFVARGLPDGLAPALSAIERAWGVKVVAFHNNVPEIIDVNGVHVGDNALYVNVKSDMPLLMVVGHELTHEMQKRAPALYEQLRARVAPLLKNQDRYRVERLTVGRDMPEAGLQAEMIADFVGENFTRPEFWRQLAGKDPTLLDRLAQWVLNFLNRALQSVKGLYRAERFVSDVTTARDAVVHAMAEFAKGHITGTEQGIEFSEKAQPWYSELERQVIAAKTESAPAAQWVGTIKSMKGVKADEVEWSGVLDWLATQTGKVSKWDIQKFLAQNGVKVEETMLGGRSQEAAREQAKEGARNALMDEYRAFLAENPELRALGDATDARFALQNQTSNSGEGWRRADEQIAWLEGFERRWESMESGSSVADLIQVELDSMGYTIEDDEINDAFGVHHRASGKFYSDVDGGAIESSGGIAQIPDERASDLAERYAEARGQEEDGDPDSDETRHGSWVLPGGQNYREILLTMPPGLGGPKVGTDTPPFRFSHWDQVNILAHVRINERESMAEGFSVVNTKSGNPSEVFATRAEAEQYQAGLPTSLTARIDAVKRPVKTLFVEEIQSDWAQKGKREGFKAPLPAEQQARYDVLKKMLWSNEEFTADQDREWAELDAMAGKLNAGSVPSAPFVGKTEAWVALAVKRIIRYASENGFDRVAMVTGEQSADRYSLRHVVDNIQWSPLTRTKDGWDKIVFIESGRGVIRLRINEAGVVGTAEGPGSNGLEGKALEDVIGKAGAEKILSSDTGKLEGEGLNIGGEGMVTFYNKIVPNVVNDVLKKLGGGKMGKVNLGLENSWAVRLSEEVDEPYAVNGLTRKQAEKYIRDHPDNDLELVQAVSYQPGFDITPELRERAMQGMPLFQERVNAPEYRQRAVNAFNDLTRSTKQFNWWDKTVGTQLHKASKNPWFRRVFERGQQYLQDVNEFATRAMDEAPNILLQLEKLSDIAKMGAKPEELKAVASVIFSETLANEPLDAEALAQALPDEKLRGFYYEARNAINRSLDDMAASEWVRKTRNMGLEHAHAAVKANLEQAEAILLDAIDQKLAELRQRYRDVGNDPADESVRESIKTTALGYKQVKGEIHTSARRIEVLKSQGYAPLMRFGKYSVHVWHESAAGSVVSDGFFMYESEREANAAAREITAEFPDSTVDQGIMSQESWKVFQGVSPDTLEVFARALGAAESPVFQEYLRLAVNNRSALKRLIKRKGISGFSEDLSRVLASFVTSNARRASGNWHFADMLAEVEGIPKGEGDVKDEAVRLVEYLQNPREEAAGFRSFLFAQFLGGSVAAAMVNMTQPILMTFPYLHQYGATVAMMLRAAKTATNGPEEGSPLAAAMEKAALDGIIAPNEIHQLYAESIRSLGSNIWVRRFMRAWGSLFAVSEAFNRRLSFAAGYEAATARGMQDPYAFAVRAVEETQGIYNRGNRPNWARGALGATIFTFKQFSVAYLEFLTRLPNKEKALALGMLLIAAGAQGLPFADDLDDLIDTLGQSMGYNTNSKRWKRKAVTAAIGDLPGRFVLQGFSAMPGIPLDVQGRLGVGNLIPGSAVFKRSEVDKGRDVLEFLGPAGGVVQAGAKALGKLQEGSVGGAVGEIAPTAVKNALKAFQMAQLGVYQDTRGRRVIDVDGYDAAIKAIGFQPSSVAQESRRAQEVRQSIAMVKVVEGDIAEEWARGLFERDTAKVTKAREQLLDWNRKNPESPIRIVPAQIHRRLQEIMKTREQRLTKSAPREIRGDVKRELQR